MKDSRAKLLPRHHGVNLDQRVLLGVQARVTVRKIEKTHLRHRRIPTAGSLFHLTAVWGGGQFIEVPFTDLIAIKLTAFIQDVDKGCSLMHLVVRGAHFSAQRHVKLKMLKCHTFRNIGQQGKNLVEVCNPFVYKNTTAFNGGSTYRRETNYLNSKWCGHKSNNTPNYAAKATRL